MILCSLKGELRVFVQELFRFVFVQLTGLFFTLWFWRSPRRTLPAPLDPLLLEPATALAAKVRSGKVSSRCHNAFVASSCNLSRCDSDHGKI